MNNLVLGLNPTFVDQCIHAHRFISCIHALVVRPPWMAEVSKKYGTIFDQYVLLHSPHVCVTCTSGTQYVHLRRLLLLRIS